MRTTELKAGTSKIVEIESLAYRGEGIGHVDNKVIFVPLTAPGDQVELTISENKKNYLRGTVRHFRERSPHRIVPLCDYFGECGGCHWQHLSYACELAAKQKILQDTLARIGKLAPDTYACPPPIPSPRPYGYRCRIRLQGLTRRRTDLGFFRAQSKEVIPIGRCELAPEFLNETLKKLLAFLNSLDHLMTFAEVQILVSPVQQEATLSFSSAQRMEDDIQKDFLRALKAHIPEVYGVSFETATDGEPETQHFGNCCLEFHYSFSTASREQPVSVRYRTRIHTFSQVNPEQNQNLLKTIYEWAEPTEDKVVLDLFCGAGNLSLPLARHSRKVIGLESSPLAVDDARSNAALNELGNCDFRLANVYEGLDGLKEEGGVDILIVDPPRKGAKECIGEMVALRPSKILYVSCDPTTLARDLTLLAYAKYQLKRIQLLDMFPQTYHVECVAEFVPEG
jgi:23S rRNA (uracil1939-C5)-methyltransferase